MGEFGLVFFFFNLHVYCALAFRLGLSQPAIFTYILFLLLLPTIAMEGDGEQESAPVAYGFPLS